MSGLQLFSFHQLAFSHYVLYYEIYFPSLSVQLYLFYGQVFYIFFLFPLLLMWDLLF